MKFSQEMIHAYADGELQGTEKNEFESALQFDAELQQSLDDILSIKQQLRMAYQNVAMPVRTQCKTSKGRFAAYAALLLVAFTSGWMSSDLANKQNGPQFVQDNLYKQGIQAVSQVDGKYILHIGISDKEKFRLALDKAESLLAASQQDGLHPVELEVVANASGLDLFRDDASPFAQRVKLISQKYPNIKFIACSSAIERLQEQGIEANLIPAVQKGPTALDQVVKRMNEGWTYIKI